MAIQIDQWNFNGPFTGTEHVLHRSGAYVILTRPNPAHAYRVIDVGESGDLKDRLDWHDRKPCWTRNNDGELAVAVLYGDERVRLAVEAKLRQSYTPVCGIR